MFCLQIYGPESSGKTTLALHAIAEVQKQGGTAVLIDAEHAFDVLYARVCQPASRPCCIRQMHLQSFVSAGPWLPFACAAFGHQAALSSAQKCRQAFAQA